VVEKEAEEEKKDMPEADSLGTGRILSTAFRLLVVTIALTSLVYTLTTTGIGGLFWGDRARGDLVRVDGQLVGSRLVGQEFDSDKYFHPRPSSKGYDASDSGSANLAPTNEKLTERAKNIISHLTDNGVGRRQIPVSFVTESGSALDPHIVPASALMQVPRISEATGISQEKLKKIVNDNVEGKFLGIYGQKRVNVLALNLRIWELTGKRSHE